MSSLAAVLRDATARLDTSSASPRLDAEILLAHALGWERSRLLAHLEESPGTGPFQELLNRRIQHEPVAYILGTCEFFSMPLAIRPPILVPRPETEHLVEVALEYAELESVHVLDLCTGSGCVALAIAANAPSACVVAVDLDPRARALAQENAAALGLDLALHEGDLFAALPPDTAPFDIITANPPYVEDACWNTLAPDIRDYESRLALLAGEDGLDCIRRILEEAPAYLVPGGLLALEVGESHYPAVADCFTARGYGEIGCRNDLAGIQRIVIARWPG